MARKVVLSIVVSPNGFSERYPTEEMVHYIKHKLFGVPISAGFVQCMHNFLSMKTS
jgi:hypothetical protein